MPLVAGHDRRLAAQAERADQAARVDGGDLGVVALVLRPAGDVLDRAVGVVGVDGELLLALPRSGRGARGRRVIFVTVGSFRLAARHAGGDPAADELVLVGVRLHASCRRRGRRCRSPSAAAGSRPGAAGNSRRPRPSFTSVVKSSSGSKPSSDRRKPFCPLALPWQPPQLQPSLVKIGTIWLAKLIGRFTSHARAVDRHLERSCRRSVATISVVPLASGTTRPVGVTAADLAVGDRVLHVVGQVLTAGRRRGWR